LHGKPGGSTPVSAIDGGLARDPAWFLRIRAWHAASGLIIVREDHFLFEAP